MGNKPRWCSISLLLLGLLLVSSCVIAGGYGNKTEEETKLGPLEPPFTEIIPSAKELLFTGAVVTEKTIYYTDGSIAYSRTFANEAASQVDKTEGQVSLLFNMLIYDYSFEEEAGKRIQKERKKPLFDEYWTTHYAELFGLPIEDVVVHVVFFKEPDVEWVQGEETIFFRIGRYVGAYEVHVGDPPELTDGFIMPPELANRLEAAVNKTISKLRSL